MLEVIHSRGLPLDRITTTDVWATETISANLPPVEAFKEQMDQKILDLYRIEVEHLCARNKDGSKKTYEQMFYHVPNRRSQNVQVERERERARVDQRIPGYWSPLVSMPQESANEDSRRKSHPGAENSRSTMSRPPFWSSTLLRGAKTEVSWSILA